MGIIWPEIFTDKDFEYSKKIKQPNAAVADGLTGWANCHMSEGIPRHFSNGMLKILQITGTATSDGLMKIAGKLDK